MYIPSLTYVKIFNPPSPVLKAGHAPTSVLFIVCVCLFVFYGCSLLGLDSFFPLFLCDYLSYVVCYTLVYTFMQDDLNLPVRVFRGHLGKNCTTYMCIVHEDVYNVAFNIGLSAHIILSICLYTYVYVTVFLH